MENDENNPKDQRPSTSELLGTSPEQIKRQNGEGDEPVYQSEPPKHTLFQMYIGTASIILIILGIVMIGIWFFSTTENMNQEPVSITPESFFAVDEREEIRLTASTDIPGRLETIAEDMATRESFSQIYFTESREEGKRLVTAAGFVQQVAQGSQLIAPYVEDEFMYGFYTNAEGDRYPYLVFKVRDYERLYGRMLQTEAGIVTAFRDLTFPPVGEFSDEIILNQDVRVATGGAGRSFLYSFPRPDTLVITTSEDVLREIFSRL